MKTIKPIHPFPARMAPELAIKSLSRLDKGSTVLDPMMGSGTVVRHAAEQGHQAYGFDLDPLAVLISRVWSSQVDDALVNEAAEEVLEHAKSLQMRSISIPAIDDDHETKAFVDYWFAKQQRSQLRRIAFAIASYPRPYMRSSRLRALDVLKVALSRIIITKDRGASLARDVSHSRPHRVMDDSEFDVFEAYSHSLEIVRKRLLEQPPVKDAAITLGDARSLSSQRTRSVDAVITSPPYLNAIDYMRGHRMSLVWLGYRLSDLRPIRSRSVGAERYIDDDSEDLDDIVCAMVGDVDLDDRMEGMIQRYASDAFKIMCEISRVLSKNGHVTIVIGNSCLKSTFINNGCGYKRAGEAAGLVFKRQSTRVLPPNSRYLPIGEGSGQALEKRMRAEVVLEFEG
ncbi:MAG: hypothetical protein WD715_06900 [Dongiaceae bacterium]